ncbi:MAG TPA: hypothetical protein VGS02_06305, partial [Acidobacteriaceae bacterium]|nr:hypothetical protein [Acidobacteriaceae bacterium]
TGVKGETLAGLDLSSTTHTNAGTYATDGWTFTDATGNYNNASGTVSDHIAKANATISVNAYSVTYDGNTHTATGSATGVKGETLAGLDLSGTTHTNAGTYASDPWTFHDPNGNYADGSGAVSDSIGKANAAIGVSGYSVTYDGNSHTATGSATGVKNETLAGLDLSGTTHANAGTYATDAWTFTDAAGNYNNASGTVSDAIARAKAAISVTPYSVTYDGNAHTATGSATGVKGESLSGLDLSNTTHTNPGAYNDSWTFTDATGNYNGASGIAKDAIGYGFLGLEAPYAPPPTTFNVQRTMPIVWQYTNANGAVVNSAAANPQVQIFSCGTIPDNSTQDITVDSAGNSGYQYNSTTNTWQFNWQVKASNLQAGCYDIYIVSGQTGQMSRGFPINITSH